MSLRAPISGLAPGSCACSADRAHCACMPADASARMERAQQLKLRRDASTDPVERSRLAAEIDRELAPFHSAGKCADDARTDATAWRRPLPSNLKHKRNPK